MGFLQNILYNKSIRRLRQMLESVRMRDFSLQYSLDKLSGEERRMAEEINAVIREFRESEHRHAKESHFYDALLSTVDFILIACDEQGRVHWMNNAAIEGLCGFRFERIEELKALHPTLPNQLTKLKNNTRQLVSFTRGNGEEMQYAASVTNIFVSGLCYRLYSLQSVATILKQSEIVAQQRLIRVLTHEIMNSLTPIVSLSDTIIENITNDNNNKISNEDINLALSTISRRANGLMQFVQSYRRLSGIAAPVKKPMNITCFIQGIKKLFSSQKQILFEINCKDETIEIDQPQMEQVFINLLKNSIETKATAIKVNVTLSSDKLWLIITVEDNGGGFTAEVSENIFTPFFSTKQNGEGIGLAVCRQIVCNHSGLISAECINNGTGARFTVRLPIR